MNRAACSAAMALSMLTACGNPADSPTQLNSFAPPPTDLVTHDLEGTRWVPRLLAGMEVVPAENRHEQFIVLQSGDRSVVGNAGCNRLGGSYETKDDTLIFSRLTTAGEVCPDTDREHLLLQALERTAGWRVDGAHLELFDASGSVLARFESMNL